MTNQFDLNKLNSFLDSATQAISCDSECQNNKKEQQLNNKYRNAQSNLNLAEPQYEFAKQKYYTYVSGQSGYNEMIEKESNQKADLFIKQFKENYDSEKSKLKPQLETYDGILINFSNIIDLYEKYKKENVYLFKELKDETNDVLTNERKTYYEDQENDYLNLYYYYFLLVIYCIIVICFCFFSLIYPSTTNWKARVFLGLIFIVLPFISTWLLGMIIKLIYWLFSLLPKNVYK
jgi:hypothetical protein